MNDKRHDSRKVHFYHCDPLVYICYSAVLHTICSESLGGPTLYDEGTLVSMHDATQLGQRSPTLVLCL